MSILANLTTMQVLAQVANSYVCGLRIRVVERERRVLLFGHERQPQNQVPLGETDSLGMAVTKEVGELP